MVYKKSKAELTVTLKEYIVNTNVSQGTAFRLQGLRNNLKERIACNMICENMIK